MRQKQRFATEVIYEQPGFMELQTRFPGYIDTAFVHGDIARIPPCRDVGSGVRIARCIEEDEEIDANTLFNDEAVIEDANDDVEFELVFLNRDATAKQVLLELSRRGLRPAVFEELLCFEKRFPDESLQHPIAALGSTVRSYGGSGIPYIWSDANGRRLDLYWADMEWYDTFRFLAVRVESQESTESTRMNQIDRKHSLLPDHFRVQVNRNPLPSVAILEQLFCPDGVSDYFNGAFEWKRHSSRAGSRDVTDENVILFVRGFDEKLDSEDVISWAMENGYVPANEKEACAAATHPAIRELARRFNIVCLGAYAMDEGRRFAAVLGSDGEHTTLEDAWFDGVWGIAYQFLFVRAAP